MLAESARVHHDRIAIPPSPLCCAGASPRDWNRDDTLAASIVARPRLVADFEGQFLAAPMPPCYLSWPLPRRPPPNATLHPDCFSPKTLYAMSRFTRFVNLLGFPRRRSAWRASTTRTSDRHADRRAAGSDLALLDLVAACAEQDRMARPRSRPRSPIFCRNWRPHDDAADRLACARPSYACSI
jgi:hypothetical protein